MNIHEKLRKLRMSNCRLQKDVASDLGISRVAVNQYESGKLTPSKARIQQFASYYNVDIKYLLDDNITDSISSNITPDLSVEEKLLLDKFNKLPKDGKLQLLNMAEFLLYGNSGADKSQTCFSLT